MYDFTGTNQKPIEKLSALALTYDGTLVDSAITGFQVLNVYGRETVDIELETFAMEIGSVAIDQRIDSPPIRVEYLLETTNEVEFKSAYSALMKLLIKKENIPFKFADEEATYYGRYVSHKEVENLNHSVVGEFEIYRSRPFKYGIVQTTNGTKPSTTRELEIEQIEATVTIATKSLSITNGTFTMRFLDDLSVGNKIVIDFKNNEIKKNGLNFAYALALDSDFENFNINAGGSVTSTQASIKLFLRERWL